MKKYLPKKILGFTLIELLIVVAIIAVLAVIGIAIFTGQQKAARDARRRSDVEAIASAMESQRGAGATAYTALAAAHFSSGVIPIDPSCPTAATCPNAAPDNACLGVCKYCLKAATGTCAITDAQVAAGTPGAVASWTVCANLEAGGSFCRSNAQ